MIFWEHIKGLNINNTVKAWTYINFQKTVADNTATDVNMSCNPVILFGSTGYNTYNKNYILTSHMTEGYINNAFTFKSTLTVNSTSEFKDNITLTAGKILYFNSPNSYINWNTTDSKLTIRSGSAISLYSYNTNNAIEFWQGSTKRAEFTEDGLDVTGNGVFTSSCQALYFNATSDYRAKKDFKLLDINALELIKKVRLYSFQYKDSNQPSIGIIAQDVQDVSINGFDLVDNKNATGDNFDYMSIHESKLVYILWKAIQEQQKEIEELKQQLNK